MNIERAECDPTQQNLYTQENLRCDDDTGCPKASRPVGLTSSHYFNVGLAVGPSPLPLPSAADPSLPRAAAAQYPACVQLTSPPSL